MIRFSDPKDFISESGSPIHVLYSPKVSDDGTIELIKVGEENTDDLIQACKESTDIDVIVSYYNQTGDTSVLNQYVPHYGDFTKIPTTLAEFLQLRIDSQRFFDAMPKDVKDSFDNNADVFFATAGNEDWYEKIKPVLPPDSKPEVKEGVEIAS